MDQNKEIMLEMKGIHKNFGGVNALIDAELTCTKGEVHALLGENGAGKSTLVKILCGVVIADSGNIKLFGKELKINSPIVAEKNGISAVFQELSLVPYLSVAENIFLGREIRNRAGIVDFNKMVTKTEKIFNELDIEINPRQLICDMPLAKQQLVEIAKAISKDPQILILDEATSALGNADVKLLFSLIKKIVDKGKTVLFISHRMDEIEEIADSATIFRDAKYITQFKMGTVSRKQIIDWIAGRTLDEVFPERKSELPYETILEIKALSLGRSLRDINIKVKKGEILGVAGLQGHGQNEFLRALFGMLPVDSGHISFLGKSLSLRSPRDAIKAGIVLVPEDRKTEGLLLSMSVGHNLSLMILKKICSGPFLNKSKEYSEVNRAIDLLNIKTSDIGQATINLSGGNQQKIVIGKTLLTDAKLLLLADPTRGIDVGTKAEIYQLIRTLSEKGVTIMFLSTELNELVGMCDRVIVFKQGSIVAELSHKDLNEKAILNASFGIEEGVEQC